MRIQERVARFITANGGQIEPSGSSPGVILARVTEDLAGELTGRADVEGVTPTSRPHPMNSVVDGSPTWHAAGYTGQAPNADNPSTDGPDVLVNDEGITTNHVAFNVRLPTDCASCAGTGPSMDPAHPAAGPHTRVISSPNRTSFTGSKHGNAIAAVIATTNLARGASGTGMAYGIDKLYDSWFAKQAAYWALGIDYMGEQGVSDIAEIQNYSAGTYEDTIGYNPQWRFMDAATDQFGQLQTIAAGNCGIQDGFFTNCYDGPHRVCTPGNLFNVLTVGGLTATDPLDPSTWSVWPNSSSGPTWDGRKKPDLVATPGGGVGHPQYYDLDGNGKLDDYGNSGYGTSYAAPQAAAGAVLLASVGVYSPMAQRAILINSARPIQNQTYWTPTSGWGALDLDRAFHERGSWTLASVHGAGANSARFFETTGVGVGDRATLIWNRRATAIGSGTDYYDLTNLDLIQISPTTGGTTATGGSDAADDVDTNQTPSGAPGNNAPTDNPMPGSGEDGEDNVEQVRSTATGTQILKVKALSAVDGRATEPFALASKNPLRALQTPIPELDLESSAALAAPNELVTLTATITNPSADLPLQAAEATLSLPVGASLALGAATQSIGTLAPSGSTQVSWQVVIGQAGLGTFSAGASGTTYGETFAGEAQTALLIDADPPSVAIKPLPVWSASSAVELHWSASDDLSGVATYDVETSTDGTTFSPLLTATSATSTTAHAADNQTLTVRVRARDLAGNVSDWVSSSTSVDTTPPVVVLGAASTPAAGRISVPVQVLNTGAPASATYSFGRGTAAMVPLTATTVSFTNYALSAVRATLVVTATDVMGRSTTQLQTYTVASRYVSPKLKLAKVKTKRRLATIAGSVAKGSRGTIKVVVRRVGKKGTKRVRGKVVYRGSKFSSKVRLKPGRYKASVSVGVSDGFRSESKSKSFRVRQ